eukprot:SAG11_NODE_10701_length_811_cov_1.171348_1_plen_96_part_10
MEEQYLELKAHIEGAVTSITAQISNAMETSDAHLIAQLLNSTKGCDLDAADIVVDANARSPHMCRTRCRCEHLFGTRLRDLRDQFEPILSEARIAC